MQQKLVSYGQQSKSTRNYNFDRDVQDITNFVNV